MFPKRSINHPCFDSTRCQFSSRARMIDFFTLKRTTCLPFFQLNYHSTTTTCTDSFPPFLLSLPNRIPDSIAKDIEKYCSYIYPLTDVYIRKVKVVKRPKYDLGRLMDMHGESGSGRGAAALWRWRARRQTRQLWATSCRFSLKRFFSLFETITKKKSLIAIKKANWKKTTTKPVRLLSSSSSCYWSASLS